MRHKLAGKLCGNQIHMEFLKMETTTTIPYDPFYPTISNKIPLARCQKQFECFFLKAKDK